MPYGGCSGSFADGVAQGVHGVPATRVCRVPPEVVLSSCSLPAGFGMQTPSAQDTPSTPHATHHSSLTHRMEAASDWEELARLSREVLHAPNNTSLGNSLLSPHTSSLVKQLQQQNTSWEGSPFSFATPIKGRKDSTPSQRNFSLIERV